MITFNCKLCRKEYTIDESKIGQKAKCSKCGTIIIVPDKSENELIFDTNSVNCISAQLQELINYLTEKYHDKIESYTLDNICKDKDIVFMNFKMPKGRTQFVHMYETQRLLDNGFTSLVVISNIGKVSDIDYEMFPFLLEEMAKASEAFNLKVIGEDDSKELIMRCNFLCENWDVDIVSDFIYKLALLADLFETALLDNDSN